MGAEAGLDVLKGGKIRKFRSKYPASGPKFEIETSKR
jgi:hypothetical protein